MNAFLDHAGAMIDFLEANSEVKFNFGNNYPDYHPDHPGGAEEGRSIHGKAIRVDARHGIVFAAGGFPHDADRTRRHFKHLQAGTAHASLTPEGNTGDALRMAEDVNAALDDSFSNAAAWVPVSLITRKDGRVGRFFHLIDRAKPGVIAVTREGLRFTNESENYHDFVCAMIDACAGGKEVSAFMICDHRTIRRYGLGAVRPSPLPLFPHVRSGYLKTGRSIRELAISAGIVPEDLERTIEEVNRDAAAGRDRAFNRGATSYQRLLGDENFSPNPCIGEISVAPFYAVKIIPGDIATYHGLVTDARTRVLDVERKPIPGLFAVGNDAASIFGGSCRRHPRAGDDIWIYLREEFGGEPRGSLAKPIKPATASTYSALHEKSSVKTRLWAQEPRASW